VSGLDRVGAFWKPRPGSKAVLTGALEVDGRKLRVGLYKNEWKAPGSRDPDYRLLLLPDDAAQGGHGVGGAKPGPGTREVEGAAAAAPAAVAEHTPAPGRSGGLSPAAARELDTLLGPPPPVRPVSGPRTREEGWEPTDDDVPF